MPSPGRWQSGIHVGTLRISVLTAPNPNHKERHAMLSGIFARVFSLSLSFSVLVLLFASVRQSLQNMQNTLSTYVSSCWIALISSLAHLHWIKKNSAILYFSLDWKLKFLFIGWKFDCCKAVSVIFSGLAQAFLLRQSVVWFSSVGPSLGGENPLIKVYHAVGWLEQKKNDLCLWQWILHEPSLPSRLSCYDRWIKKSYPYPPSHVDFFLPFLKKR